MLICLDGNCNFDWLFIFVKIEKLHNDLEMPGFDLLQKNVFLFSVFDECFELCRVLRYELLTQFEVNIVSSLEGIHIMDHLLRWNWWRGL